MSRYDAQRAALLLVSGVLLSPVLAWQHAKPAVLATQPASSPRAPQTIMLFWVDRIEENGRPWPYARMTEWNHNQSWVAKQLEELLADESEQWELIVSDQHEILKKIHEDFARLSGQDYQVIRQIAADHGAQYYIVGYSHAIGPQQDTEASPGEVRWYWKAFAQGRMYRTDTGKLFASPPDQSGLTTADLNPDWGRIDALRRCGDLMAPKFLAKLREKAGREEAQGRSVAVTILNASPSDGRQIKRALRAIARTDLEIRFENGVLTTRWMSRVPADELAADIYEAQYEGFELRLVEAQYDAIRFELKRR